MELPVWRTLEINSLGSVFAYAVTSPGTLLAAGTVVARLELVDQSRVA